MPEASVAQPASLKKTRGEENHAYFRENWGEEKLRGKRLNYLRSYLHCLPLIFSKIFSLARLHFIFIPQTGDTEHTAGTVYEVCLTFKSGTEKRRFSVLHFDDLMSPN